MPNILRRMLGFVVLIATVGLATCQSMVKAEPVKIELQPKLVINSREVVDTQ